VRENRTPGSVRGLPGNWQSYRDQLVFDADDGNAQFLKKNCGNRFPFDVLPLRTRLGKENGRRKPLPATFVLSDSP
jgi:hypothetical protein